MTNEARLGDRSLFPGLAPRVYLNHGGISPPSRPVVQAVQALLGDYEANGAWAYGRWATQRERLREALARLIGAGSGGEIALEPNTSRGVSDVAMCLRWRAGDRVVIFEGEFPANVTPWQQAARTFGLELVRLPIAPFERSLDEGVASVERALAGGGVRLVAVSAVQFQTGLRMPLGALGEACRRQGARLFVDAVQAAGAVPLDVAASGVDYLAAGSHKWLMGLEGAGFLYASPAGVADLEPRAAGWLSHIEGARFLFDGPGLLRTDRPIKSAIGWLEGGNVNGAGCAALEASLGLIASIGVEAIHAHVNRYHDALESGLRERGFRSERHPDPAARSCTLSVVPPGERPLAWWSASLLERGVGCATPDGRLRFTPHWPNALAEVSDVLACIDEVRALAG